jgi:putative tryptophan/tyrosine transport system substrate-binding protein
MRRRDFITLLGGAAAWPVSARAQQAAVPVVGFLSSSSPWEARFQVAAFVRGLSETGFIEGQNVLIDYRWAEGHYERLPTLATELARRQPNVIAAMGTPAAPAAKAATATIPIVFRIGVDPVDLGLAASLNRPGGNLTGVVSLNVQLEQKRLELLHELVPTATTVAALVNSTNPNAEIQTRDLQAAADSLGFQLHILRTSAERDFERVFETLTQLKAGALSVAADPFFGSQNEQLGAMTLRHTMPTIKPEREFAAAGGLIAYGASYTEPYRLSGVYCGRILKGEKPSDLPIQQSTKLDLVINLKTAKMLGLTVPLPLLTRADEVIE